MWLLCGRLLPHPEDSWEEGWGALTIGFQGAFQVRAFPFIHFLLDPLRPAHVPTSKADRHHLAGTSAITQGGGIVGSLPWRGP